MALKAFGTYESAFVAQALSICSRGAVPMYRDRLSSRRSVNSNRYALGLLMQHLSRNNEIKFWKAAFYVVATLALTANVTAQRTTAPANKKFAEALEAQISCRQKPQPSKAIRALQNAGIAFRQPYNSVDSVNYFKIKQPLRVLGLKVYSVLGFDTNPKIFERGPGTSPGILLGVVVPYSVDQVKSKLKALDTQKLNIEEARDEIGIRRKSHIRTEISCQGGW